MNGTASMSPVRPEDQSVGGWRGCRPPRTFFFFYKPCLQADSPAKPTVILPIRPISRRLGKITAVLPPLYFVHYPTGPPHRWGLSLYAPNRGISPPLNLPSSVVYFLHVTTLQGETSRRRLTTLAQHRGQTMFNLTG